MKRKFAFKSLLSLAVAGTLFCGSAISAFAEDTGDYKVQTPNPEDETTLETIAKKYNNDLSNKVVIVSSNDTHGAILQFAYFAAIKNYFEKDLKASGVLLVDSGDFCEDKKEKDSKVNGEKEKLRIADYKLFGYLSEAKHPERSVELMNAAGYDYACLGNHEFDKGEGTFNTLVSNADFQILDANITNNGKYNFKDNAIATFEKSPLKIGLFGLDTHEIEASLKNIKGLSVKTGKDLYNCAAEQVIDLKQQNADLIVCLSHLGLQKDFVKNKNNHNDVGEGGKRSVDVYAVVPEKVKEISKNEIEGQIDLMLDAHSHTAIFAGANNEPIMSGQIWGNFLGITIIDNESKQMDRYLLSDQNYEKIFGTTAEERVSNLKAHGAGEVIKLLEEYTGKDAETLFDYDYNGNSSSDKNPGNTGRHGKNGKDDKNDKNNKNDKYGRHGRNSGKNDDKNNGKNNNSRFGKRSFEYDEEDTEFEEEIEAVEDSSVEASTTEEDAQITSEAIDENSATLDEQTTDEPTDEASQDSSETSEQDNAEQSEETDVEPAA
ncbi:hypothetical protein D6853_14265 [Butyrivibrio sp. X503]|uniref:hypothetical protein n=1 Tax=Butyrivibrio sp. X503 TaxID=2364878 RepID=UPI000EA894F0|nr:hypothetical protein [Butyrivibrio sp. X503]RKM54099.1 hypothetical protein D6853_14265 [Butyrivibrio sp. X503]